MASVPLLRLSLTPKPLNPKPHLSSTLTPRLPSFLRSPPNYIPPRPRPSPNTTITRMSHNPPTPAPDRLISALAYTLPFFNSLQYGRFVFLQYPNLAVLFDPILPLLGLYKSIPYASFVAFFALYLGVVRNPSFSQYVRFNAMQAVTLDVLLVVPLLIQRIFNPGRGGIGFRLMVMGHNVVFVFSLICFVYSFVSCVLGRTPYLPFVADAAGRQI